MARAAVPLGALLGLAIGACFTKPPAPGEAGGSGANDGGPVNDGSVDAAPLVCTVHSFNLAQTGCGGVGALEVGSASTQGGQLSLTALFSSSTTSVARCQSTPVSVRRLTLDIAMVPSPVTGVRLKLFAQIGSIRYGADLVDASILAMRCGDATAGSKSWVSVSRYLRLAMPDSDTLALQVSPNATDWTDIGECVVPTEQDANVGLELERVGPGSAMTATFESLEICQ